MVVPLLKTKFYIPSARSELVPRQQLLARLNESVENGGFVRKLTLISAPAGYGKTTLLSIWLRQCTFPVAWLSLDEGDNDLGRFLAYVVAALQTIQLDFDEATLEMLRAPQLPPDETLVTVLINALTDVSSPFLLVLDDYHNIAAQPIHSAIAFLLDHLPPQMHIVIATRADPPLPLARLRARGHLAELRQSDLRFAVEETIVFLNNAMGLTLSTEDVVALEAHIEGWAAGLQMAGLALRGRLATQTRLSQGQRPMRWQESVADFISDFTGSDRYILDYLVEEVLQRQPGHIQTFLLQTSILDQLTSPLCDAILCKEDSDISGQEILEYLERNNLFVIPMDNERGWYRYHHLFADLLRQRLQQTYPSLVSTLHHRASMWHEHNGLMTQAIHHALAAEDFERAANLVEQGAEVALMSSQVTTFLNWIALLPEEFVRARPALRVFHTWALLWAGFPPDNAESCLQDISEDGDLPPGKLAALRGSMAVFQGQLTKAAGLFRQALAQLPEKDVLFRSTSTWILSIFELVDGNLKTGSQTLNAVVRMSQKSGNVMIAVQAICYLAKLNAQQGHLYRAQTIYQQALTLATNTPGQRLPIASEALTGLGKLFYEWNDLESAARYLEESVALSERWSETAAFDAYIPLAQVRHAQGDSDAAQDAVQRAQYIVSKTDAFAGDNLWVALIQGRLWITQGNFEAVLHWAKKRGLIPSKSSGQVRELDKHRGSPWLEENADFFSSQLRKYEHLVLARLWIAQDQPEKALALLASLLPSMEARGRKDLVIEIQNLKALAFQRQDDLEQALVALEYALSLAAPGGFVRIFVDEGQPMARLLYEAAAQGIAPEYAGKLLAAFPSSKATPLSPDSPTELIESLSARELEVLQLIAEGLSNQEIAQHLVLSLPTVKWHTGNIYGKLVVKNRTQAVVKARTLGILPTL